MSTSVRCVLGAEPKLWGSAEGAVGLGHGLELDVSLATEADTGGTLGATYAFHGNLAATVRAHYERRVVDSAIPFASRLVPIPFRTLGWSLGLPGRWNLPTVPLAIRVLDQIAFFGSLATPIAPGSRAVLRFGAPFTIQFDPVPWLGLELGISYRFVFQVVHEQETITGTLYLWSPTYEVTTGLSAYVTFWHLDIGVLATHETMGPLSESFGVSPTSTNTIGLTVRAWL